MFNQFAFIEDAAAEDLEAAREATVYQLEQAREMFEEAGGDIPFAPTPEMLVALAQVFATNLAALRVTRKRDS